MKIGIISQARMTSSRLPKKILMEVKGKTLLDYHVDRLQWSGLDVYIATTSNQTDNVVEEFCHRRNLKFFRGSEQDVLSRYYQLAKLESLDIIVRVTSDCPLIDGYEIRKGVDTFLENTSKENLYLTNCQQRTYPRGFDFEIFTFASLKRCFLENTQEFEREHVTPFIWKSHPDQFNIQHFVRKENDSNFRITVDETDDFKLIKELLEKHSAENLRAEEIIKILRNHPELVSLNSHVEQKKV